MAACGWSVHSSWTSSTSVCRARCSQWRVQAADISRRRRRVTVRQSSTNGAIVLEPTQRQFSQVPRLVRRLRQTSCPAGTSSVARGSSHTFSCRIKYVSTEIGTTQHLLQQHGDVWRLLLADHPAYEMTYIVSGGALNSTHSPIADHCHCLVVLSFKPSRRQLSLSRCRW